VPSRGEEKLESPGGVPGICLYTIPFLSKAKLGCIMLHSSLGQVEGFSENCCYYTLSDFISVSTSYDFWVVVSVIFYNFFTEV
jgi:hypothetical protein